MPLKKEKTMRNLLIALWAVAVIAGSVLAYHNREKLDCEERTYVRHSLTYTTTQCK